MITLTLSLREAVTLLSLCLESGPGWAEGRKGVIKGLENRLAAEVFKASVRPPTASQDDASGPQAPEAGK